MVGVGGQLAVVAVRAPAPCRAARAGGVAFAVALETVRELAVAALQVVHGVAHHDKFVGIRGRTLARYARFGCFLIRLKRGKRACRRVGERALAVGGGAVITRVVQVKWPGSHGVGH
jgi:hypothetical protein